jgi:hypothetical protein
MANQNIPTVDRKQSGIPGGVSFHTITLPTSTGNAPINSGTPILNFNVIVPVHRAKIVSAAVTVAGGPVGSQTSGTNTHSLMLKSGSTNLLQSAISVALNTDAVGTYEGSALGVDPPFSSSLGSLSEGTQIVLTDTVSGGGTINVSATVTIAIVWGY